MKANTRFPGPKPGRPAPMTLILTALVGFAVGWMLFMTSHQKQRLAQLKSQTGQGVEKQSASKSTVYGDPCSVEHHQPRVEYWGTVVVAGKTDSNPGGLIAETATECCRACQQQRGCNEWVWCLDTAVCGQQCWLKREPKKGKPTLAARGPTVHWTSGLIEKDFDVDPGELPDVNTDINTITLKTEYGSIKIRLKPGWSDHSVTYVRQIAAQPSLCTPRCQFYRAEPGFLLQGSLDAYIPANKETKPGPKLMERGDIGWAGGGAGPDWFIYLGKKPATHFGTSHTVWGRIEDAASLAVVERIVKLPTTAPKPDAMHMLNKFVDFIVAAA